MASEVSRAVLATSHRVPYKCILAICSHKGFGGGNVFPFLFPLPFLPGFFSCFGEECNGFWILCAGNGQLHFILKELSDLPHAI